MILRLFACVQKRPDVHKIVLSIKLRFRPPPPGKSVNFTDLYNFFLMLCLFSGGGGCKTKFCGQEFYGHTDFLILSSERKRHINIFHINFLCRPSTPGCLSQGQTGFVPGTNRASIVENKEKTWVCPWDKLGSSRGQTGLVPGTNLGSSQDQLGQRVYVY